MILFLYSIILIISIVGFPWIPKYTATFLIIGLVDILICKAVWQNSKSFISWRGRKYKQLKKLKKKGKKLFLKEWNNASLLKKAYIIFSGIIGFALFILFCILYLQLFLVPLGLSPLKPSEIDSGFALAFLGTVTGGVALFTGFMAILRSETNERQSTAAEDQSKAAEEQSKAANEQSRAANEQSNAANEQSKAANRQADTAEQGLITDRINKATEGLGKSDNEGEPVIEVRLGALYALERIAQDSIRDHVQIMEILCAYIRTNSPRLDETDKTKELREDVHAAITIIGRRQRWPAGDEHLKKETAQGFKIDLHKCDLHGAKINRANLNHANLNQTDLSGAELHNANLGYAQLNRVDFSSTRLYKADLNHVELGGATLINSQFYFADLSYVEFNGADLTRATFFGANTDKAFSHKGDFSKCTGLNQDMLDQMYCGKDVGVPDILNTPEHWVIDTPYSYEFKKGYDAWLKELKEQEEQKQKANEEYF